MHCRRKFNVKMSCDNRTANDDCDNILCIMSSLMGALLHDTSGHLLFASGKNKAIDADKLGLTSLSSSRLMC